MTTIDTRPDAAEAASGDSAVESSDADVAFVDGAAAWLTSTDHKRVGRIYIGLGLLALLATSVLGGLLGLERADDSSALLDGDSLLQLFQAYRVALVFAVIAPLTIGLAIAVVPLQLGARALAFPRLALTGLYCWLAGLALNMAALGANGGLGGADDQAVELFLASIGLMILGLLASAGAVATSVLTTRAPGMTMRRVPLFSWSALISAIGLLIALPVAFGAIILLFLDVHYSQLAFGGSETLAPWIGWAFSTPMVAVFAIPAAGMAAELVPVAFRTRQAMRGVTYAGIALIGVTALAAATQQYVFDVSFDSGQSGSDVFNDLLPLLVFSGLPILGAVIVMGVGALTAKNGGRPRVSAALVLAFLGFGLVALGLVGNLVQGITDLELLGTVYEEGITVLVVYGTVLAVMGGIVFWAPKLWGRTLGDKQVVPLALLGLAAALLASVPYIIAGFAGQFGGLPAANADVARLLSLAYDGPSEVWNILTLVGHALMLLTALAFVGLMFTTFTGDGDTADDNPFDGQTIEWSTTSPAPTNNFAAVPTVTSSEPLLDGADRSDAASDRASDQATDVEGSPS